MKDLRILFMGTPDFAVATLAKLIAHSYTIVGVVTAPDKPAGRGRKLRESAIKVFAIKNNLKLLQPTNLKAPSFIEELRALDANLQIVVAFRMLPKIVWQMPEYGTFNLHASLLPNYRGAAPINWAIINGETQTGVTTFFIDEKIDTGAIILQEKLPIEEADTAGSLHDKLMQKGAELVLKTVILIQEGQAESSIQVIPDGAELKSAFKIDRDTCRIDWNQPMSQIQNLIRGLSPYPTAWTIIINDQEEILLKIYSSRGVQEEHDIDNGLIICTKKELKVAVAGGFIYLNEIQLAGKRRMEIKDAINGLDLSKKAYMV